MDAWDEGFKARLRDDPLVDNPYAGRTDEHVRWHAGWLDQQEHLTRRDDALASIGWHTR